MGANDDNSGGGFFEYTQTTLFVPTHSKGVQQGGSGLNK